jgi:hypothetical protein
MRDVEHQILAALDRALRQEQLRTLIDSGVRVARQKLERKREALLAWETLPLEWYGNSLPGGIRSGWVFILRAGAASLK